MRINFQNYNKINLYPLKTESKRAKSPILPLKNDCVEISFCANPSDFKVKNIINLHCPACGKIMLSDGQIEYFVSNAAYKKGQDLADFLEKYENEENITGRASREEENKNIFRGIHPEVIEIYKELAPQYPNMDLHALTQIQAQKFLNMLIKDQMRVVNHLNNYVEKKCDENQKQRLKKVIDEYVERIYGNANKVFTRKGFIADTLEVTDEKHKIAVEKILEKLPSSANDINSFFVKYSKADYDSEKIARILIEPAKPTTEHIHPKSLGGKNSNSNYFCDCSKCNGLRGDILFDKWIKTWNAQPKDRLQQYLKDVRVAINMGILGKSYEKYFQSMIDTIKKESHGKIILENPVINDEDMTSIIYQIRSTQVNELNAKNGEIRKRIAQLEAEIREIKALPNCSLARKYLSMEQSKIKAFDNLAQLKIEITNMEVYTDKLKEEIGDLTLRLDEAMSEEEYDKVTQTIEEKRIKRQHVLRSLEKLTIRLPYTIDKKEKTAIELQKMREKYKEELRENGLLGKARSLVEKEKELSKLKKIFENNNANLRNLRNYENMTNEEYNKAYNLCLKECSVELPLNVK